MKNNKIKVKGYTRMVYNQKKQKLQPKKTLRIKKTTVALFALFTAISVVALQFRGLISDIRPSESIQVPRVINSQVKNNNAVEVANLTLQEVSEVRGEKAYTVFNPKTQYFDNELETFRAVNEACIYHAIDTDQCRLDLMGIVYAETRDFTNKLGDGNKSRGRFQIHKGYHPQITDEMANDPYFAAKWTLARMINKGYKTNRDIAIRYHNGSPTNPKTKDYLDTVNYYISL